MLYTKNMETHISQDSLAAWETLIRTIGPLLKTFDHEMERDFSIPLTWYDVLIQLSEASEGKLRMQALTDKVVLSRSGLTRLLDRMEHAGLVRREHSPEDRRGYYAVLTDQGRHLFSRAQPAHLKSIQEHFARHLSAADIRDLARIMGKVHQANQSSTDSP